MTTTTHAPTRQLNQRTTLAMVIAVAIFAGGNFTALKFASDHSPPLLLTGLRAAIGGPVLFILAGMRGESLPRSPRLLGHILVVSLVVTTGSSALLVYGVSQVPAGVASLIASTMPLFTAVLAYFALSTRIPPMAGVGLAVGLAGTATLASGSLGGDGSAIGLLAMVGAAFTWAFGTVYLKWADFSEVSAVMLVAIQLVMSAVVLLPVAALLEDIGATDWSPGLLVPLAYASLIASAVNFTLLSTIALYASPTQASATAYLMPFFGVLFGWLIADETLGWTEFLGGLLVIAGVVFVVTARATDLGPRPSHSPSEPAAQQRS